LLICCLPVTELARLYTRVVTVTHPIRLACAVLIGLILLLVDAIPAAAHAALVSSDPAAEAALEAPFDGPIVLTFDEALATGSSADLHRVGRGGPIASATVDGDTLLFTLDEPLDPDNYVVLWTSVGADRDVDRGEIAFSVVAPLPTPTQAPTTTAGPTASQTPSSAPTASPTPSGNGTPAGGTADVLFPLLAVVIAIAALGAFLLRNRRSARY